MRLWPLRPKPKFEVGQSVRIKTLTRYIRLDHEGEVGFVLSRSYSPRDGWYYKVAGLPHAYMGAEYWRGYYEYWLEG